MIIWNEIFDGREGKMDLRNLNTFIHVAEYRSFTRASEELGYAQSTVSSQIRQLEEELDTQLFERINRTVSLTESGKKVLEYAYQIKTLTSEMGKSLEKDEELQGHIRLASADSMCGQILCPAYLEFRKKHPKITMKFMTAGTAEMMRLLNHNEADLICTLDNHIYSTEYVIAHEEKMGVHFVAGKNHPLLQKTEVTLEELLKEDFILTEKGMSYRRILDEKLATKSYEINPVLETGNTDKICWLVEQGVGISFLPDYATSAAIQDGRLAYLPVKDFEIDIWKQLIYHRDKWRSPVLKTMIEYCCQDSDLFRT